MTGTENLFKGKEVTFQQILQGEKLGGSDALLNYLSYRRDTLLAKMASFSADDPEMDTLLINVNALAEAEMALLHLTKKKGS